MSSKKSNQTQVPNGTGSTELNGSSQPDPDSAFRKMFDAIAACSKQQSFYLKAEATGQDLNKVRAQLSEKTKQYNKKEVSYDDLLQKTTDDRERFGREKKTLKAENEALRKELESFKANLSQQKNLQADLQQQVKGQKKALDDIADALKHEKALSASLDTDLKAKEKHCESANAALKDTSAKLRKWQAYESNLVPVDINPFRELTEHLWCDAVKFAHKYFYIDVSEAVLEKQADWMKQAENLYIDNLYTDNPYTKTKLPSFPASNSEAAKSMRMAIALAVFASLISKHIFLTTYVGGETGDLHDLLVERAYEDDKTASLCRALLFSFLSPKVQDKQIGRAVKAVEDNFSMFAGQLLVPNQYKDYTIDLKSLIRQAMSLWQGAQRSTVLLDAQLDPTDSRKWAAFGSTAPATPRETPDEQGVETEIPEEDVVLVVFPTIIRLTTGSEKTVFTGMALEKSQMIPIEEEMESERNKAAARARNRPGGRRRDSNVINRPLFLGNSS